MGRTGSDKIVSSSEVLGFEIWQLIVMKHGQLSS
jgi:hypothetical protein